MRHDMQRYRLSWPRVMLVPVMLGGCATGVAAPPALRERDRQTIRDNDAAYVSAWLRDDTAGVLSTLADDVVLVPGGLRPMVGRAAARAFWFPSDGSHTALTTFTRSIDEIDGAGDVAYVRGSDSLRF